MGSKIVREEKTKCIVVKNITLFRFEYDQLCKFVYFAVRMDFKLHFDR